HTPIGIPSFPTRRSSDLGGIRLIENGGNIIQGNFLGTDPNGTTALGDASVRVFASSGNLIGGVTPEARNVIAGIIEISGGSGPADRKSTRLNSSHGSISY